MPYISENTETLSQWSEQNTLDPSEISMGSGREVFWDCTKGHTYSRVVRKQVKSSICPYCKGVRVIKGINDCATLHPDLLETISKEDSQKLSKLGEVSTTILNWNCLDCSAPYKRKLAEQITSKRKCDNCRRERSHASGETIDEAYPELVKYWSSENIQKITKIPYGSAEYWKWTCSQGHLFAAQAYKLSRKKRDLCPVCSNIKTIANVNDIETTHKEITEQWDYSKNTSKPYSYNSGSNTKIYWICNDNHSFKRSISGHVKAQGRCPDCKTVPHGSSMLELGVLEYFKQLLENESVEHKDKRLGFEIDIYLPERKVGFEVNGDYWHNNEMSLKAFGINSYERHSLKLSKSNEAGIDLYYIWESDWKDNRNEIEQAIEKLLNQGISSSLLEKLTLEDIN